MFLKNCWYCAGWDYALSQGKGALLARRIAGESLVLYRKLDGGIVAMEDRCPHRQAALSLGRKEGDQLRCLYHGMKFGPDGRCTEIPGQERIPQNASVRVFPVVEKNNWIWVWMGEPAKADPGLICVAIGPDDPHWNLKTSQVRVNTNYRLEIANLADLSHTAWLHEQTFGGTAAYSTSRAEHTVTPRGMDTVIWLRKVPAPAFARHLLPPEARFDLRLHFRMTVPCNFILHFQVFAPPGEAAESASGGQLVLETCSCQAVTPRDADAVDYYYSIGPSRTTDSPGLSELLRETVDAAFREDKAMLEAQYQRLKEKPDRPVLGIVHDEGPAKMLRVLDGLLREEAQQQPAAVSGSSAH